MKNILNVIALLILIGGGFYLYQMFMGPSAIHIVKQIQHELSATEEFVFSRDKMKFTQTENNKALLAHVDFLYTWEASVPFGFASRDLDLSYEKSTKRLIINVKNLRLYPFQIVNPKSKKTSEFGWLNQGEPVAKFWESINPRTEGLINGELERDAELRASIGQIARNSLTTTVMKILSKLDLGGIEVMVSMNNLRLYDGKVVDIGDDS